MRLPGWAARDWRLALPMKTRHEKWPLETEGRNDAFLARSGTRRPSQIPQIARNRAVSGGGTTHNGGDRTGWLGWQDSNSGMSLQIMSLKCCTNFLRFSEIVPPET